MLGGCRTGRMFIKEYGPALLLLLLLLLLPLLLPPPILVPRIRS
jgi:hypothetical protein